MEVELLPGRTPEEVAEPLPELVEATAELEPTATEVVVVATEVAVAVVVPEAETDVPEEEEEPELVAELAAEDVEVLPVPLKASIPL